MRCEAQSIHNTHPAALLLGNACGAPDELVHVSIEVTMKHVCWILVAVVFFWTVPAWAQATATTGQIEGTVTDESKGALPGVTVTVHNVQTGFMREGVSDEAGLYRLSLLPLGTYELTASLQGF